jgi:signal transduction histidine kinase
MKIQTKTTILFTLLTATIFLILNVTVYFFIDAFAHRDFNKRLELRARLAARFRFEQGQLSTQALSVLQRQYLETLPEEEAHIIRIDPISGRPLEPVPRKLPSSYLREIIAADGGTAYLQLSFRHYAGLLYRDLSGHYLVIGSATNEYGSQMMRQLRLVKFGTFICAVLLIYSVGLYFSRKTFQPIRDIISRVREISQGNLHLRLKGREGSDEIAELTQTFNQMLNRLETAFEAQNNFISNASHELRTPLTAIIGEADFALSRERSAEAYRGSLQQISEQAEKLQQLTKGLLALAQTGFDGKSHAWQLIRLDQLLMDVKEACLSIVPGCVIQISMDQLPAEEEDLSVLGNYDLLKIAVSNVVLNACKYSNNKPVHLQLLHNESALQIRVRDEGIGIPGNELKYIYDPFFRASNTKDYAGYGIGMPLSNNIIRLHNGQITVRSTVGKGTEVNIFLPLRGRKVEEEQAGFEQL